MLKAQASTEFMALVAVSVAMLGISLIVYSLYSTSAAQAQRSLEAEAICQQVSSFFGSFHSLGDGAQANFSLPATPGGDYTVWMFGDRSLVKVEYDFSGNRVGTGCTFPAMNVTNIPSQPGGRVFQLNSSFALKNSNSVIVVG
jgi:hypothetical protein